MTEQPDVTVLLKNARGGDESAQQQLFEAINDEMRKLAGGLMRSERQDHTLQASALVNEAYMRMREQGVMENAANRRYLFGAANNAMRQILIDHARKKQAKKRGGEAKRNALDMVIDNFEGGNEMSFLELDEALDKLGEQAPRQREIVELKFFSGLTIQQISEVLELSHTTIENEWKLARAKLFRWLSE
ncbi:MAG: sigma-70 family RNA polymerase sigma factor [Planctomycetota bacterium]